MLLQTLPRRAAYPPGYYLNFLLQVIANLVIEVSLDSLVSKQDRRRIRNLVAQRMMPLTSLQ